MAKRHKRRTGRGARAARVGTPGSRRTRLAFEPLEVRQLLALTPTTVSLASSLTSVAYGAPLTLTATVDTVPANSPVVSVGTVTFLDGTITLGTAPVGNDTATLSNVELTIEGVNSLSAVYSGSGASNIAGGATEAIPSSVIITTAGAGLYSGDGGPATAATLLSPADVAVDSTGDVFIADTRNDVVREVNHVTGVITTVAGNGINGYSGTNIAATAASIAGPSGLAVDTAGDLFIAAGNGSRIWEVNHATGIITTVAGDASLGYGGDGGQATAAELDEPRGIALNSAGDLYIADTFNDRVREVNHTTGIITTVAGNGTAGYAGNSGAATAAELNQPVGIAVDASGDVFIADSLNSVVRELPAGTGVIRTMAGTASSAGFSGDTGPATAAKLDDPQGVAVDSEGNLFIADAGNGRIREVAAATGLITSVAGNGTTALSGDGGLATAAGLSDPGDVTFDAAGNLLIAESGNDRIREVNLATQVITSVAGTTYLSFSGNGGPATAAILDYPYNVATDSVGDMFIADEDDNVIREVNHVTGVITTVAGDGTAGFSGNGGQATTAELNHPQGLVVDSVGDLFIADSSNNRIREVNHATGLITTVGGGGTGGLGDGGPATAALLSLPAGLALDSSGDLYIADYAGDRVREINATTQVITTVAGNGTAGFNSDGIAATSAELYWPMSVAVDSAGNLFIADDLNNRIREVNYGTGLISTVAGTGSAGYSGDGGLATASTISHPPAVAVDAYGDLIFTDATDRIREVNGNTGILTTVVGAGFSGDGDGGPASAASVNEPDGLALDASGDLYIADTQNNRVREILDQIVVGVVQATPTVAVTDAGGTYTSSPFPATATVNGSSSLEGVTPTLSYYSGTAVTGTALSGAPSTAGTYSVVASFAGSTDYNSGAASTTFIIGQATPGLSVSDNSGTFTGNPFVASDSVTGVGSQSSPAASLESVSPSVAYFSGATTSGTALAGAPSSAGTYTVLASFAGSTDYKSLAASGTLTISQATPTVSVSDNSGLYTGAAYTAATASIEGVTPALLYYAGTATTGAALGGAPSHAGTYVVVASFAGSADYASGLASTTFSILQAVPTLLVVDNSGTYTTAPYQAGVSIIEGNTPALIYYSGTAASGTPLGGAPSGVGTYSVLASFPGSTDYVSGSATTSFTIGKATPILSVSDGSGAFTGSAFNANDSVAGVGSQSAASSALEGVSLALTYYSGGSTAGTPLAGAPSAAGTYAVLASFAGSADYGPAAASNTFSIRQAAATVSVTDGGGTYSGAAFAATAPSIEGVPPTLSYYTGSTATGSPLGSVPSHAGTYSVVASFAGSADYTSGQSNPVTFVIAQAPLTITAKNQTKSYGAALPALTASFSGFVGSDSPASLTTQPTLSTTASAASHVAGSPYTITVSGAADPDYAISYAAGSLTVTPVPLTITANNQTMAYGGAVPTLTASYSGLVNGDTPLSLTTPPTLSTTATSTSPAAGSPYPITVSGAVDPDYTISYVAGSLTITSTVHTPSVTNATAVQNGQSTAGLVITPNALDTGVVTNFQITSISGGTLFLNNGTTPVTSGEFITVAQGAAGLKFSPTANSSAAGSFGVQASTSATAAGLGGSVVTATITVTVVPPTSSVTALGYRTSDTSIPVSWSGTVGSGGPIKSYNVLVSINGGPFSVWQSNTTATAGTFTATVGNTYGFISQAKDTAGNVEALRTTADTTVTVTALPWHNPTNSLDVLGTVGSIVPQDALAVITYLNLHPGNSSLPATAPAGSDYYDVLGNNNVTPADALAVINYLNLHPAAQVAVAAAIPAETAQPDSVATPAVVAAATSITLTASPTTITAGQTVTLTATLSSTATPSEGSVTFTSGSTTLGTVAVSAGSATLHVASLPAGLDAISAAYSDAAGNFAAASTGIINAAAGSLLIGFGGDGGPATAAELSNPVDVAFDSAGDMFIVDGFNARIREVNHTTGIITTVAGDGTMGYSGDNGPATLAEIALPAGIAVDSAGDIFFADQGNNRIREVNHTTGIITTVAGNGIPSYSGDGGAATAASLNAPAGVAVDAAGDIFIADSHNSRVREVTTNQVITTIAGNGIAGASPTGGQATAAELVDPTGVALDAAGDLFIANFASNLVCEVKPGGAYSVVAGNTFPGSNGDGGPATAAALNGPGNIAVDSAGDLFIADVNNNRVQEVTAGGYISTVAGNLSPGFPGNGVPATMTMLRDPSGVALDSAGNLYIADSGNNEIRDLVPDAEVLVSASTTTVPPTSSVSPLGYRTSNTSISVSWSGTAGGGGPIQSYEIQYSVNGGAFQTWLSKTTATSGTFTATVGNTYGFISQATDTAGNVEPAHTTADTTVTVMALPWHNGTNPYDVLGTGGQAVPQDALAIINYLNLHPGGGTLPATAPAGSDYFDVLGNNNVVPADALAVINYLNVHPAAVAPALEGPPAVAETANRSAKVAAADALFAEPATSWWDE